MMCPIFMDGEYGQNAGYRYVEAIGKKRAVFSGSLILYHIDISVYDMI